MHPVTGVILAAGQGTRMRPLTNFVPKPMLPIANRPLLEHHLDMLRAEGIERVVVVIGHLGEQIRDALHDGRAWGMRIEYVQQTQAEGIAHALGLVAGRVSGTIVVVLGDIYFATKPLGDAIISVTSGAADAVLLSKVVHDRSEISKNFQILADAGGRVSRVEEKPKEPVSDIKGCGLYVFSPKIFPAIMRTPRSSLRNEFELTDTLQILIEDGATLFHAPQILHDINLSSPADLLRANQLELASRGMSRLIGDRVELCPGALIEDSVICDGVQIKEPIRVRRSVVLQNTVISSSNDIDLSVVGPAGHISCTNMP